jgi:MoaD family protein
MTITIQLPATLRAYCPDAQAEHCVSAPTVREALGQLERSHPAVYRSICDETGALRQHINLFVNNTYARNREGLDTALQPGDVITIMPAVSGG